MLRIQSLGPDTAYVNAGGMITMEGEPRLEHGLTAMAVRNGRIVGLGADASMRQMAPGATVVDLEGAVVMPGLIDCHNHFLRTTLGWDSLQLADVRYIGELLETVGEQAREMPRGEWMVCSSRWHETKLAEKRMPTAEELDQVAPNNPIYMPRGGHVVVTNSLGLQRAGIAHISEDPPGGEYVRDASGRLTGMLLERPAFAALTRQLPQPSAQQRQDSIRAGIAAYNRVGITGVREPGLLANDIRDFQSVIPQEQSIRVSLMWRVDMSVSPEEQRQWVDGLAPISGFGSEWLDIWGLKIVMDGGVEAAYLHHPYANNPDFRGIPFTTTDNLKALLHGAHGMGWKIGVHVAGDASMDMVLDAFEQVDVEMSVGSRGHALEHAFSPVPGAIERTRDLGIAVTLQHALVYSLAGNMVTYWGDQRAADCTPSRAWLDSGTVTGAGTDSPVTNYDPWLNVYGFATRDTEVAGVLGPQHRISIAEALKAYTVGSATVQGQQDYLGSLAEGKAADFICLDRDPLASTPEQVRSMDVKRTVIGGRQVHPR